LKVRDIIFFAPDKKIISRTFKIRGALVFLCPKEGEERRETKDEKRETRDERREPRDERRETRDERRETRDERRETRDERRETRDERQETRDERRETGDGRRETRDETKDERRETSELESKSAGYYISKPPGPKWKIRGLHRKERYSMYFYVPQAYILHLLESCRFSKRICFPGRF
jgi:septal ring factor EnvC (AmiA/AmiB activator)